MSYVGDGSYFHIDNVPTIYMKLGVELSKKEIPFLTKIGLRKQFYFDSYLWSSFEYKNW